MSPLIQNKLPPADLVGYHSFRREKKLLPHSDSRPSSSFDELIRLMQFVKLTTGKSVEVDYRMQIDTSEY